MAERYLLDREFFDPLAAGDDPFPGQHAYSHAIALSSGAKAWLTLGDARYKQALQNAFDPADDAAAVRLRRLGTERDFHHSASRRALRFAFCYRRSLRDALRRLRGHQARALLLRFTGDPRYADNLERVLYNTILAVKLPDADGDYPYYSTYSPAATKVYYQKKWPCCSGTLVQTVADYPLNLYFQSADGLYVNLYTPSTVTFTHARHRASRLTQRTALSRRRYHRLTIDPDKPADLTIYLRIPAWARQRRLVEVNGKPFPTVTRPGRLSRHPPHAGAPATRIEPHTPADLPHRSDRRPASGYRRA